MAHNRELSQFANAVGYNGGNIGIQKTPKEWNTNYRSLQIHDAGYIAGSTDDSFVAIGANNYLDTGGSYDYTNSDYASQFYQVDGEFVFRSAGSGTADNAITWAERLRITSAGKVNINTTVNSNSTFLVKGLTDNTHPVIKFRGTSANGYTFFGDEYQTDESQFTMGLAYSAASIVTGWGVKVSTSANNVYLSSQDSFATKHSAIKHDSEGWRFLSNSSTQTVATDSAVTLTERLRITSTGQLQATGAADVRLTLGSGGTAGTNDSVHMRADGANLLFMNASGGLTKFESNGTETFRISGNGDIGINKSSITSWGANIPTIEIKGRAETGSQAVRSGAIAFESGSGTNGYALLWGNEGGIEYYSSATNRATAAYGCKFTSSGNLAFASGKGIDFSSNANAAGMTNELLDDYEEGTWTPVIKSGTNTISYTGGQQRFYYTKIGSLVTVTFTLNGAVTSGTTGGGFKIEGLPFLSKNISNLRTIGTIFNYYGSGLRASAWPNFVHLDSNSTTVDIYTKTSAGGNYDRDTVGNVGSDTYVMWQVTYETAA